MVNIDTSGLDDFEIQIYYKELADYIVDKIISRPDCEKLMDIIMSRIEYGYTFKEIGDDYERSPNRMNQLFCKSMRIMKYHGTQIMW